MLLLLLGGGGLTSAGEAPPPGGLLGRMLAGPMAGVEEIVFAERVGGSDHWYANFGRYSAPVTEYWQAVLGAKRAELEKKP